MDEETIAAARLGALAHSARLKAFRLLIAAGPSGVASGEIAATLSVPPTAMSFHLSALERSGLIFARREGRHIYYAVQFDAVRALLAFLTEDCCRGRPELCGRPKKKVALRMEAEA
jgi:DNA-binding transcriptional ArsR family regulator